ncbi:proteoglycan 4-like [Larimichthys crocea]|uniref:proteoglycan 4-like n=1 Tax=Larimichthys crocea TaxID=215358 RepID=UPI000F5DB688|nr:proteoglycan 4-like [Larimichthys crocea]
MSSKSVNQYGLKSLLECTARPVLLSQPPNIANFMDEHLTELIKFKDTYHNDDPKEVSFQFQEQWENKYFKNVEKKTRLTTSKVQEGDSTRTQPTKPSVPRLGSPRTQPTQAKVQEQKTSRTRPRTAKVQGPVTTMTQPTKPKVEEPESTRTRAKKSKVLEPVTTRKQPTKPKVPEPESTRTRPPWTLEPENTRGPRVLWTERARARPVVNRNSQTCPQTIYIIGYKRLQAQRSTLGHNNCHGHSHAAHQVLIPRV